MYSLWEAGGWYWTRSPGSYSQYSCYCASGACENVPGSGSWNCWKPPLGSSSLWALSIPRWTAHGARSWSPPPGPLRSPSQVVGPGGSTSSPERAPRRCTRPSRRGDGWSVWRQTALHEFRAAPEPDSHRRGQWETQGLWLDGNGGIPAFWLQVLDLEFLAIKREMSFSLSGDLGFRLTPVIF